MLFGLIVFGLVFGLVGIDHLIKYWAVTRLAEQGSIPVWRGVFHLTYVENRGAAFGFFQGQTVLLAGITLVVLGGIVWLILSKKTMSKPFLFAMVLIVAGGIGNLLDRVFRGFVVDMLDFCLINFPVFNFADCCVVIGTFLALFLIIRSEVREAKAEKTKEAAEESADDAQEND